jgi:hypothetical protein
MNTSIKYLTALILEEFNLEEAKQLGTIYHFTSFKGINGILRSNKFWGSKINLNDVTDKDFRSFFGKTKEEFQKKSINELYYFSTTRNKLFYLTNPKGIGGSMVRIVLDGDKLSNKYKFTPFYYYSDETIDEPAPKHDQDESEERILLGTQSEIPSARSYIKEIHILLDKVYDNQEYLKLIAQLIKKYPKEIKCFYKEKPILLQDYIKNVLPTIEPYGSEEDIYEDIVPTSKSFDHEFKDALISLVQYMIEQDMNILPLPSLKIIDNDVKNANNILGKTAHYDPNNCSITLYTLNRHPKDILRSFTHEMIHRIQDNEGRLNNINTTNTNEEGDLPELEKEAYLKGNMCLRNWEDSIKNV